MNSKHSMAVLIAIFLSLIVAGSQAAIAQEKAQESDAFRMRIVKLSGGFSDHPSSDGMGIMDLLSGAGSSKSFYGLCEAIEGFAKDPEIDGVFFDLSGPLGLSQVQLSEFSRHFKSLKAAKKKTFAWLESAGPAQYSVAANCDEIVMADFGGIDLPSLGMSSMHFRDAMDLLGVRVSIARMGNFKGAVEPYMLSEMSQHLRDHYVRMLTSMNKERVTQIATGRKMSNSAVRKIQSDRMFTAEQAKKVGLVDHLTPYGTSKSAIAKLVGQKVEWVKKGDKKNKRVPSFFEIFGSLFAGKPSKMISVPTIAVLHLKGEITDGQKYQAGAMVSGPTVKEIKKLTNNDMIHGVIVRVNSPGGSATASEAIRQALVELAEKKEVVISMGDLAASGGYWISCLGKKIYAEASTVTGSIGVFALKMSFGPLLKRVGVHIENITLDDSSAAFAMDRQWSEGEIDRIQESIAQVYDSFLGLVSKSRGLSRERLDNLAGGRVWSGIQAKSNGLVDELGGLDTAFDYLSQKIKTEEVPEFEMVHLPNERPPFEGLDLFGMGDSDDEIREAFPRLAALVLKQAGFDVAYYLRMALKKNQAGPQIWALSPVEFQIK